MSMAYVRKMYGVPAHRGQRVIYNGRRGRITSADHRIRVRFDGHKAPAIIHPTERGLTYLDATGQQIWPTNTDTLGAPRD